MITDVRNSAGPWIDPQDLVPFIRCGPHDPVAHGKKKIVLL